MEDSIGRIECGSKSDSIAMRILRSAMDRTQEKLQFKDGPIELLHEQTTFYELAAILVEGCLKIVKDDESNSKNEILSDLIETREWLTGRIRDLKELIKETDREFGGMLKSESRLEQREIRESANDKVLNIKQKMELDKKMILNSTIRARSLPSSCPNLDPDSLVESGDEKTILHTTRRVRTSNSDPNLSFNASDEDEEVENDEFMKRTLDLVFGRMQLAEMLRLEKKWRRGLEREVEKVLLNGFLHDLRTKLDIEIKKIDGLVNDSWFDFDFIDEMKGLFHELKDFFSRHDLSKSRRASSEPDLDVDYTQNLPYKDDDEEVSGSPRVWEIVKSHESIIRKQHEQRDGLLSWIKRYEDINAMERLIQDAIVRLENFSHRKHKVSDLKGVSRRNRVQERRRRRIPKPHRGIDRTSSTIQSFEAEIKKLQEERDGLCFQISTIEDIYQLLFRGVKKDFSIRSCSNEEEGWDSNQILMHYMKSTIREDVFFVVLREMVRQWKTSRSDSVRGSKLPLEDFCCSQAIMQDYTESLLREEIYKIYFKETIKAWRLQALTHFDFVDETIKQSKMSESSSAQGSEKPQEDFRCSPVLRDCMECLLREGIYKIYFQETIEARRSEALKKLDFDVSTPQSRVIALQENVVEESKMSPSDSIGGSKTPQEDFRGSPTQDCTECLLKEEINKVYLREMTKAWRSQESKQYDFELRRPPSQRPREGAPRSRRGDGGSSLNKKVDSLLKSLEQEEHLVQTASSLIKHKSLVIRDREEMDTIKCPTTDNESTLVGSVSEKLERALQQLHTSKELLAELEEGLEFSDGGEEYNENSQSINILRIQEENTNSELDLEGVGQTDWSENVLAIIKKFRILVDDIEVELHENLDSKFLRLEALKRQVDSLSQPVAWIRTRKLLYEKAFISRCRNLKLAETEVDLLGDQVEALLYLLERIYFVLSRDAKVLSNYFEVHDVLKLIKIELSGGRSSSEAILNEKTEELKCCEN